MNRHPRRAAPPARPKAQIRRGTGRPFAPGDGPLVAEVEGLGVPFRFDGAFARRLARRHINPTEAFTVCDRAGAYYRASLKELSPEGGFALPYELMDRAPEAAVDLTLACAVLARQRMIFIMQKATELGVARIVPLLTAHAVPPDGLEHEKAHAWPGQVIRAARQCRRSSLPEILPPSSLEAFLVSPAWRDADLRLWADDRSAPAPAKEGSFGRIVLVAGPEGGFSEAERALLSDQAHPWRLGGRILRAETAVIVGLAAIHLLWGDFRSE